MNIEAKIKTLNAMGGLLAENEPRWPACVYTAYAADGAVLYIGSATHLERRMGWHRLHSPWFPAMASYSEDWYPTRKLAYELEAEAIRAELPPWNVAGKPRTS
jgi:predicted GIY-YIG superfamily endonuclease